MQLSMACAEPHGHESSHAALASAQLMPAAAQTSQAGAGAPQYSSAAASDSGPHKLWSVVISPAEKRMSEPVTRSSALFCSAAQMLGLKPDVDCTGVSSLKLW